LQTGNLNNNVEINNKRDQFHQFLSDPDQADLAEVQELCKKYPYMQSLWFLQARLSVLHKTMDAKDIYQKAILFSGDVEQFREFVFRPKQQVDDLEFIETKEYNEKENSETLASSDDNKLDENNVTPALQNTGLVKKLIKEKEQAAPSRYMDDWMPYSYVWWLQKTRMEYAETYQPYVSSTSASPSINPLDQQIREHIFHLQNPSEKLSEQFDGKAKPFQVPHKENPIIEKFIKEEPQIKPPTADKINLENKARKSAEDNSGFVSETLAKIYTEQGLYHKALDTYKKLSLKYPEKSLYFADLIEELNQKLN